MIRSSLKALLIATLLLTVASAAYADARTKPIRLVPETDFSLTPQAVAVSSELTAEVEDPAKAEKATQLMASMDDWTLKAFKKLKYTVDEGAALKYHYTLDYIDFGSTGKQLLIGIGAGRAEGTIVLTQDGEEVGRFRYSAKVRIGGSAGKQIAPPLVLKLHKGERDEELHERREKADG